jgi:hypothetical protein
MRFDTPVGVQRAIRPSAGEKRETLFDPGAHCDASALPEREISSRLRTGNTAQSQSGDAIISISDDGM